jgi:hypothetical protein
VGQLINHQPSSTTSHWLAARQISQLPIHPSHRECFKHQMTHRMRMRPTKPLSLPLVAGPGVRPWRLTPARLCPDSLVRRYSARILSGPAQRPVKTVADLLSHPDTSDELQVEICGWVRSVRKSQRNVFVDITDGSSMRPAQATVHKTIFDRA